MIDGFRTLVVAGPARSGVTTTSFVLANALARRGHRVGAVLVDPSPSLDQEVEASSGDGPAVERLDVEDTFERLVRSVAERDEQAAVLLDNPLYATLTASLPGARDFTLLERMAQLRDDDRFDVLVIDTPPSLPAGEFLTAVERVRGFLGHPVYRALSVGQRAFGRVADAALSSFLGEVKNVAGNQVADATTAFFRGFSDLEGGLTERLDTVTAMLSTDTTGFVVVARPRPDAVGECAPLAERLRDVGSIAGLVINRVPDSLSRIDQRLVHELADTVPEREPITQTDLGGGPVDSRFTDGLTEVMMRPGGPTRAC